MIEFFDRPYSYRREPFKLGVNDLVPYYGDIFSVPASGALLEKRLFTQSQNHPVNTTVRVYINKDANDSFLVEPDQTATHYESGTPHYSEVITDIRDILDESFALMANDSDWSDCDFKAAHLNRVRSGYNLDNTRASGLPGQCLYVHKAPDNTVPTEDELGYLGGFQDIDIDEIQYQPVARPKDGTFLGSTLNKRILIEPIFPAILDTTGSSPSLSNADDSYYINQGLGVSSSGGNVLITGDNLIDDSVYRLYSGSGNTHSALGTFQSQVDDAEYPGSSQLSQYYTPSDSSGIVVARGRRGIYGIAVGNIAKGVYILNVGPVNTSGSNINHWPSNYQNTSGVISGPMTASGVDQTQSVTHDGVHVTDKLIYAFSEIGNPGQPIRARSPINGRTIFAHIGPTETNSLGNAFGGFYNIGDTIYELGRVSRPFTGGSSSEVEVGSVNKELSPASFTKAITTQLRGLAAINSLYVRRAASTQFIRRDIIAPDDTPIISLKTYGLDGNVDQLVIGDDPLFGGGQLQSFVTITTTRIYAVPGVGSQFDPVLIDTIVTSRVGEFFENTFFLNNIFSFFFFRRANNGFQNVNGQPFFQFTTNVQNNIAQNPINDGFAEIPTTGNFVLTPEDPIKTGTYTVGFFPVWATRRFVSVSTQTLIPGTVTVSPANSKTIDFTSQLQNFITRDNVSRFGPPIWDANEGINYIYFQTVGGFAGSPVQGFTYFAKMNTDFEIFEIVRVNSEDAILNGKAGLISV